MSLKLGNVPINKIYLGSTLINKIYLGANQVYPTGAAAAPDMENGVTITAAGAGSRKVPAGVTSVDIEIWGGGGAGGDVGPSGGGGSGAYSKRDNKSVTPGETINYTIGLGAVSVFDTAESTTSDGMTAGGGQNSTNTMGAAGGSASGGDVNTNGNPGTDDNGADLGGSGGSAPNGGAGGAGVNVIPPSNPGVAPGGGGGGRHNDFEGSGSGANGGIRFSW